MVLFRAVCMSSDGERPAVLFLDHACRFLVFLIGNVSYHHARSFASKRYCSRTADAASRSCHKCYFSCKRSVQ